MGRRQGAEGILRYTEPQSVAVQKLLRFAPMLGMKDETYAEGDDRQPAPDEEAGARLSDRCTTSTTTCWSSARASAARSRALRLTEKGYRVAVLEAGARFEDDDFAEDLLRPASGSCSPRARLLRHPAHRRGPRLADPGGRRRRRRLARLRQHALRAARGVLQGPAVARHHRLEGRAGAVLRPGEADARRRREPAAHAVPTT